MLWAGKDSVPRKRILTTEEKILPGKHRQDLCIGQNERAKGEIFFVVEKLRGNRMVVIYEEIFRVLREHELPIFIWPIDIHNNFLFQQK